MENEDYEIIKVARILEGSPIWLLKDKNGNSYEGQIICYSSEKELINYTNWSKLYDKCSIFEAMPRIVDFQVLNDNQLLIVYEHFDFAALCETTFSSYEQIRNFSLRLIDIVENIHKAGLYHNNLNSENILVSNDVHPIIAGFILGNESATKSNLSKSEYSSYILKDINDLKEILSDLEVKSAVLLQDNKVPKIKRNDSGIIEQSISVTPNSDWKNIYSATKGQNLEDETIHTFNTSCGSHYTNDAGELIKSHNNMPQESFDPNLIKQSSISDISGKYESTSNHKSNKSMNFSVDRENISGNALKKVSYEELFPEETSKSRDINKILKTIVIITFSFSIMSVFCFIYIYLYAFGNQTHSYNFVLGKNKTSNNISATRMKSGISSYKDKRNTTAENKLIKSLKHKSVDNVKINKNSYKFIGNDISNSNYKNKIKNKIQKLLNTESNLYETRDINSLEKIPDISNEISKIKENLHRLIDEKVRILHLKYIVNNVLEVEKNYSEMFIQADVTVEKVKFTKNGQYKESEPQILTASTIKTNLGMTKILEKDFDISRWVFAEK